MPDKPPNPDPVTLRGMAEARLAQQQPAAGVADADVARLMHELQVHQIELELQNEALRQAHQEMQEALQRHASLNERLEEIVAERTADLEKARAAAEAANRAKSSFLANMSHELRTPMNAIIGMTELALRRETDPKIRDHLGKVIVASNHLLGIINDILDLSKIDAERMMLERAPFRLSTVFADLDSLMRFKARDKGLTLSMALPGELAEQPLLGDPLRLGQILLNLVSNAIRFTTEGGITVRVLCGEDHGQEVLLRFEVRDTGIGIPPADQDRIFNAFEQLDNSTTRKFGGTGLGLAICKRLVRMMGGDIGVQSSPGAGSTFWFTVRLARAAAPSTEVVDADAAAEEILSQRHGGARILLAEDEPINRDVSRMLLEDVGLVVDTAEDGLQAVEMARHTDYDLILMDMQMPRMDGLDATQAIRELPGRRYTPILAMTANTFEESRRLCVAAGMDDHIGKPVKPQALYRTLLTWLDRRRPRFDISPRPAEYPDAVSSRSGDAG